MVKQSSPKKLQISLDHRLTREGNLAKTSLLAKAGDAKGNLYISSKPGFIHARGADGNYYQVYTELKGLEYDQPIRIGRLKEDDKLLRVLSVWNSYDFPVSGKLELHGSTHSLGGRDVTPIWLGQLMWWNAQPSSDLSVQVYRPVRRVFGGSYLPSQIESLDLSLYAPSSGGAFYLLLEVLDGVINIVQGVEVPDKNQLTLEDIPLGSPGAFPIAAYARYEGQTKWILTNEWSDYVDLRLSDYGSSSDPDYGGGGSGVWGSITGTLSDQTDLQAELDAKEDTGNKVTDLSSNDNTHFPTTAAVKTAIDSAVTGLYDDRGNFDASVNAYPSSGGSGTAGAILKGDIWTVSVAGTLPTGQVVEVGDTVRALIDTPGNTQANWAINQTNIGYMPENQANKSTDINTDQASNTKYPSVKAVYDWAVGLFVALTGDQTVAGIKTFSSFPVTPSSSPTTDFEVANKKYVDDSLSGNSIPPALLIYMNKNFI